MSSSPLRLNICDHAGSCVPVKLPAALSVMGSVVEVPSRHVAVLIEAIQAAADELDSDTESIQNEFLMGLLR